MTNQSIPDSLKIQIRDFLAGNHDGVGGLFPINDAERAKRLDALLRYTHSCMPPDTDKADEQQYLFHMETHDDGISERFAQPIIDAFKRGEPGTWLRALRFLEQRLTEAARLGCHHCGENEAGEPCDWCGLAVSVADRLKEPQEPGTDDVPRPTMTPDGHTLASMSATLATGFISWMPPSRDARLQLQQINQIAELSVIMAQKILERTGQL